MDTPIKEFTSEVHIEFPSIVECIARIINTEKSSNNVGRQELRTLFRGAINEIGVLSRKLDFPLKTVVRNLISEATIDDIVIYKLLLEFGSSKNLWLDKDWIPGVLSNVSAYPLYQTPLYRLAHLYLLSGKKPTKAAVRSFSAEYPGVDFESALCKIAIDRDFSDGAVIKEILVTSDYGINLKNRLEISVYSPHTFRVEQDCPQSVPSARSKNTPSADKSVRRQIGNIKDRKLRHCLQFLAKPVPKRGSYLLHLSTKDRSEVVLNLPWEDVKQTMQDIARRGPGNYVSKFTGVQKKWLSEMCGEEFWSEILWESSSKRAMNLILTAGKIHSTDLFAGCHEFSDWKDSSWPKLLAEWYLTVCGDSEVEICSERLGDFSRLVTNIEPGTYGEMIRRVVSKHVQYCSTLDEQELLQLNSLASVKSALDSSDFLPTLKAIIRQFLAQPSLNKARLIAQYLKPEKVCYESISKNLTYAFNSLANASQADVAFTLLCDALDQAGFRVYIPLTSLVVSDGRKAWTKYIVPEENLNDPSRRVLVNTLKQGDLKSLAEAANLRPDIFGSVACRRLSVRELLSLAFSHPQVADHQVERRISRARRLAELPWVRETWSNQPFKQTAYEVALLFSLADVRLLIWLAHRIRLPIAEPDRGKQFDDMYRTYRLPKKAGGFRIVTVPDRNLKRLQRRLLDAGFNNVPLSTATHGFRKKRSILTNAVPHVGKKMVCNVDIDSFFPNTKYDQILRACRRLAGGNISERAAHFVADLCSYNGALPTGAPTSPAISNIILSTIDEVLIKTTQRFGICYTRYADDLTFSGHGDTHRILPFVERLLEEKGYHLDPDKINLFRKGRRQSVTGLVVNEKPNLPRRVRKQLRAAVHHRITGKKPFWHDRVMSDAELMGRLSHLRMVQPEEASKLFRLLNATVTPEEEKIG